MRKLLLPAFSLWLTAAFAAADAFGPTADKHIPIGIPNSVDTLKTFVEGEGLFSPGFASFGVYCWVRDNVTGSLHSPAQPESECRHGLAPGGLLIPWSEWQAGSVRVRSELCQVERQTQAGRAQIVANRIELLNTSSVPVHASCFVGVRPIGPAGWPIRSIAFKSLDVLTIEKQTALVALQRPSATGVSDSDEVLEWATRGDVPAQAIAASPSGNCSGLMRFDLELRPGKAVKLGFICPVLAGRRAVGHRWEPGGNDNFKEAAEYNPSAGGDLQPDPGAEYLRGLKLDALFKQATVFWKERVGVVKLTFPDPMWADAFAAISGHIAMNMNEGAPDVAVINYATFNRDGMYNTQVMLQAGMTDLASMAIDSLYAHPFNGRPYPEADNPGQILWVTAQFWQFTRDRAWLERVLPKVQQLAALVRYCRTTPPPHWVDMNGLQFGNAVAESKRKLLEPGKCDGFNFNYTEAYDVAGLRAAALLNRAAGHEHEAAEWSELADQLMGDYNSKYGSKLGKGYGSYCVLWPCRLYSLESGVGFEQFHGVGAQAPSEWRYFAFATAHQGLLAGNREAGHGTLARHFADPQMQGWFAFDEGPFSGEGGWKQVRTNWKPNRAMPHGWAVAELALLLRDSLVFEDNGQLVLFGGIPEPWFRSPEPIRISGLPTHFGKLGLAYRWEGSAGTLTLDGKARPPQGFVLRWPGALAARFEADGKMVQPGANGDVLLSPNVRKLKIRL